MDVETVVKVEGKDGLYTYKRSILDKYVRRTVKLEGMCYMQFAKMYTPAKSVLSKTQWEDGVSVG